MLVLAYLCPYVASNLDLTYSPAVITSYFGGLLAEVVPRIGCEFLRNWKANNQENAVAYLKANIIVRSKEQWD